VIEPAGDRFDPSRHAAGGATPSGDPSLTGTIAAVEVPGYIDRGGRVLRAPVVTVYQAGQSSTHPARRRTEEDR
jgi:molecular chaperone GrpE (heat shock protein)